MIRTPRSPFSALSSTLAASSLFLALLGTAHALPGVGAARPVVRLVDGWDRPFELPRANGKPVLVVYEDKDSSTQNQTFKAELGALGKGDRYKKSITLVAIADLQGYDYWPVRGFVKDAIQSESQKFGTVIYCDWNGAARSSLGLRRGVSTIVLYGRDGKVAFSHEGSMSAAKRREAIEILQRQVGE